MNTEYKNFLIKESYIYKCIGNCLILLTSMSPIIQIITEIIIMYLFNINPKGHLIKAFICENTNISDWLECFFALSIIVGFVYGWYLRSYSNYCYYESLQLDNNYNKVYPLPADYPNRYR